MTVSDLRKYIRPGARCHIVGIGGVSMAPLAEVLNGMGLTITGSDISESQAVEHLRALGIKVSIGHSPDNIAGAEFVVRTAAAHDDNPELMAARAAGIPVFERAQAWGFLMQNYKNALCIAGTHGKTTTTSMATHILMAAEKDPTVMIGGTLPMLRAGHRVGLGDTIILESCEYYDSFLSFAPTVAVILNIEADHLDFFKDLEHVKSSFREFASLAPEDGYIICNGDDANTMDTLAALNRPLLTFGLGENARVRGVNIVPNGGRTEFDILYDGELYAHITLNLPGRHNVMNALAAAASAIALELPVFAVIEGLSSFRGAGRRFEFKGICNGAHIYDDYAHHPSELCALLDMAFGLDYSRVILAFQPHTYSRTKALFDDFAIQLSRPTHLLLAEIYSARETNTAGISSKDLADVIPGAQYCPTFDELEDALRAMAQPGDIVLTAGAGNIYRVGEAIVE